MIFVVWALAALEIWWDWRLIERKKRSPNYRGSNLLRMAVGLALWLSWPLIVEMPHARWLFSPVMMFCNFWFLFDYGLNIARVEPLIYLGSSRLDQLQKKYGGEEFWFKVKLILAFESAVVYWIL